jgi:hypothetical protein
MDIDPAFRTQAEACAELGSPMYGELLAALADDAADGGPTARVLQGHEDDPGPSALALRLLGSIHRLVLAGEADELARFYPSTGGVWSSEGVAAVVDFLDRRGDDVRVLLDRAPQTNEVGRAAALVGGLLHMVERWPVAVRLFEIGASGGLNLQADRFRFSDDRGGRWGDPDSPVSLEGAWRGARLPLGGYLTVVERGGCDVHPVDVTAEDGRLILTSYVWPDMTERHARLAGAIRLARQDPVRVEATDAASYVDRLTLVPGAMTVLWHSVMWQYLPRPERDRILTRLEHLGSTADDDSPLVHLYAEPTRRTPESSHEFLVCAHRWPGAGERRVLGTMAPHGLPVTLE